jgi:aspartate 1-decarboxylase
MLIQRFKSKIHRAIVTQADLNYMGSITIDEDLMDAAILQEGERVLIITMVPDSKLTSLKANVGLVLFALMELPLEK